MANAEADKNILQLTENDRALIKAIEHGLPVVSHPYAEIAKQLQSTEQEVMARLQRLMDAGAIKRYGVVVRHKELGYKANGMVVWNIPDDKVAELGMCIGKYSCVTLSYRRPRRLPQWPYNLFTMVHGSSREGVREKVDEIISNCKLQDIEHTILFSTRRFKQRGASYTQRDPEPVAQPQAGQRKSGRQAANLRLVK
ncbi:MAG: AsnC family protein [Gammaproteobacteria bacterium]|nr:AsnC family protein [Gammaproteobacteria bacterium]